MRELLIATSNKGKYSEIVAALSGMPFTLLSLADVAGAESVVVEEPCATLEGNAVVKAFSYGKRFGKLTLAEDAGLEVQALDGGPGVLSARYAEGTDADRRRKLLSELSYIPESDREARFRCVVAIYDPERADKVRTCEGLSRGQILKEEKGTNGFGYDPVFLYFESGKSGGEMTREEKNRISHRGKALAKAREFLTKEFV